MASTSTGPSAPPPSDTSAPPTERPPPPTFPLSPIPANPLGAGRHIRTAAALIIGDEILNGKTKDGNSHVFARFCFEHGVDLKRIEVVPDDEADIIEASRRLARAYDLVVTSGGIGPTHDDITYASLAKAFDQPLAHDAEVLRRMGLALAARGVTASPTIAPADARRRMALFPARAEVLFIERAGWVPIVRLEGRLCVLPGVPELFARLLAALAPFLPLPPPELRPVRLQVFTSRPESTIAPYLAALQTRVAREGVRVGSYPKWGAGAAAGVHVSLIGADRARVEEIGAEVVREVQGEVVEAGDAEAEGGRAIHP